MQTLRPSRYNWYVSGALYNALTGALVKLDGADAGVLGRHLMDTRAELDDDALDGEFVALLRRGGFLIDEATDELEIVRERYWRARGETPAVLTITTTIDCNLGCYYCYEQRSTEALALRDVGAIVELARKLLARGGKRALHVDWYGGEPLLNVELMETASFALQEMCRSEGVHYVSSVISNGTVWPANVAEFVARHRIRQVQITFDGLEAKHNKRRRYRSKKDQAEKSSFAQAAELVDKLIACTRVDVRYNIDPYNREDFLPFIDFAVARGWFKGAYELVLQPARISAYTEKAAFLRPQELTLAEFQELKDAAIQRLRGHGRIEETAIPDGYPYPKTSVCAALANDSVVVGAEGKTYRCGLQVSEPHRAVGSIHDDVAGADADWWKQFDPTTLPTCSRCSFLPVCMSGCAKKHLDRDEHAIREQGRYWRDNLARMIAHAAGKTETDRTAFTEAEQFR
ncbi:MAG: SPASM domain-containing protein [Candidatus Eremiobacteraeota bacterium]|nr:SPASM domain-containing protein [Candidatus Eremiobacteraeota bacterium]